MPTLSNASTSLGFNCSQTTAVVWEQLKPNEVEALLKVGIDREAYKDLTYEERKGIFDRRTN